MSKMKSPPPDAPRQVAEAALRSAPDSSPLARDTVRSTDQLQQDPTRYGDWERNGRCIDF